MANPPLTPVQAMQQQLYNLLLNPPQSSGDPLLDAESLGIWASNITALQRAIAEMGGDTGQGADLNNILTTDFANKIQALQASLALDQTSLSRAVADIDRFLGIKEESRARAGAMLEGQEMLRQWGAPQGKTEFSLADLGAGFEAAGRRMGIDPTRPFLRYTGQTYIDPAAEMARQDAVMGATGAAPTVPEMRTTADMVPAAPLLTSPGTGTTTTGIGNLPIPAGQPGQQQASIAELGRGLVKGVGKLTLNPVFKGRTQVPPASGGGGGGSFWLGPDDAAFGIRGWGDLKPAWPQSAAEWWWGKDRKFFGIPIGRD